MGLVYGIDFGTCTSAIAVGHDDGTVTLCKETFAELGRQHGVPTSVCLLDDGTLAVGVAAERARQARPGRYRSQFKRDFGSPDPSVIDGEQFQIHELAARVLAHLRELARDQVPGDPDTVVITVPSSWEEGKRRLMVSAAELAGFDPATVRIVFEPVAAAADVLAAAVGSVMTVLVYDLGGGTFDCAVARTSPQRRFEVIGDSGSLPDIGGLQFDQAIVRHVTNALPEATAFLRGLPADATVLRRRTQLRESCETLKIGLSSSLSVEGYLSELNPPTDFPLTRDEFNTMIEPFLTRTVKECERLLAQVNLEWSDVDRIVPVGGSSRIPLVGRLLTQRSGRTVLRVDQPEFAVVHGAVALARRPATDVVIQPAPGRGTARQRVRPVRTVGTAMPNWIHLGYSLSTVALTPDGRWLAVGGPGRLRLCHLDQPERVWVRLTEDPTTTIRAAAFTPDGRSVAGAGDDGSVHIWDVATSARLQTIRHGRHAGAVAFSNDGLRVTVAGSDTTQVYDLLTAQPLLKIGHDREVTALAYHPRKDQLATGDAAGTVQLWDAVTGAQTFAVTHNAAVRAVTFNADGTRLASAGDDGSIRLWDTATRARLLHVRHDRSVQAVTISWDGRLLATASHDNTARIWDASTGAELARIVHPGRLAAVTFTPAATRLVSAGEDGTVRFTRVPDHGM